MIDEHVVNKDGQAKADGQAPPVEAPSANESSATVEAEAPKSAPESEEKPYRSELDTLKEEHASLKDTYLRQAADFQNFRKRALEERAFSVEIGKSQVAIPVLEVLDDLRRSLEASNEAFDTAQSDYANARAADALREGVQLVFEKLELELAKLKVTPIECVGQEFDEQKHDALLQQPAPPGVKPGTVITEVQKGYMIGDKVLRHARVVVAS